MTRFASTRRRIRGLVRRETIGRDAAAGLVLGVESVPDGLASGLLAGVNPLAGLYGYLFGTMGGALVTSSPFMAVQATGAMALVVADVDLASRPDPAKALFTLSILTGIIMTIAGVLKAGSLLRFVPTAVMVGFISAVGVNIVLGQLTNLTGYDAQGSNRLARTIDLILHPAEIHMPSLVVGMVTIVLIVVLRRTFLRSLGLVAAVAIGSAVAAAFADPIPLVEDLTTIPASLPVPSWPTLRDIGVLIVPAVSLTFVGLIQGAGVSAAYPPPDGRAPDPSRDFIGQGAGNVLSGLFQGMPVGGSMSASGLIVAGGACTRLALVFSAVVMAVVIVAFGDVVGLVAMPALAGLLIVVGCEAVKPARIWAVSKTAPAQTATMAVTFVLTIVVPLQYAVLVGVALAVILHVIGQSNRVALHQLVLDDTGRARETDPPATVGDHDVIILQPYGSLFFATAPILEAQLPAVTPQTDGAVVIIRLRGVDNLGLGVIAALERYADQLTAAASKLVIVANNDSVLTQIERAELAAKLGPDNLYRGTEWLGDTVRRAHTDALAWTRR